MLVRSALGVLATIVLAVVLAACGSGGKSTTTVTVTTSTAGEATSTAPVQGAVAASAHDACIEGANKVGNATARSALVAICNRIPQSTSAQTTTRSARDLCEDAAKQIPNQTARNAAEKGCERIPA